MAFIRALFVGIVCSSTLSATCEDARPHNFDLGLSNVGAVRGADDYVSVSGTITCTGRGGYDCSTNAPTIGVDASWCAVAPTGPTGATADCPPYQGATGPTLETSTAYASDAIHRVGNLVWAFTLRSPFTVPTKVSLQIRTSVEGTGGWGDIAMVVSP